MIQNKFYMYYVLKFICIIKEQQWSLTLSWPDEVQRMFFNRPEVLKKNLNQRRLYFFIVYKLYSYIVVYFIYWLYNWRLFVYLSIQLMYIYILSFLLFSSLSLDVLTFVHFYPLIGQHQFSFLNMVVQKILLQISLKVQVESFLVYPLDRCEFSL